MMRYKKEKAEWYKENLPSGRMLGYPDCCIKEFGNQPPELLKRKGVTRKDKIRYKAACINRTFTGFIPCFKHAKKIIKGEITLDSLISNRNPFIPKFPNA